MICPPSATVGRRASQLLLRARAALALVLRAGRWAQGSASRSVPRTSSRPKAYTSSTPRSTSNCPRARAPRSARACRSRCIWRSSCTRQRRYWLDETVATLEQRYELVYHALSERYLVRNLNSGEQASYATLDAALDALRVISRSADPGPGAGVAGPAARDQPARAASTCARCPTPCVSSLFWSDDWRQRSEWYTWSPQL